MDSSVQPLEGISSEVHALRNQGIPLAIFAEVFQIGQFSVIS